MGTPAPSAAVLDDTGLDDPTLDDPALDGLVRVAAAVMGVPCAAVNLFVEGSQRQLAPYGFVGGTSPLEDSLCAALLDGETGVAAVDDLTALERFADNPWVDGRRSRVRAYAGAALVLDGAVVGSLCAFDDQPHRFTVEQAERLADLACVLVALLRRRRQATELSDLATSSELARHEAEAANAELAANHAFTSALLEALPVGIVAADAAGRVNLFNRVSRAWHGLDADPDVSVGDVPEMFRLSAPSGRPLDVAEVPVFRVLTEGRISGVSIAITDPSGRPRLVECSGEPVRGTDGTLVGAVVAMADITERRALEEELRTAALHDPLTGLPNRGLLVDRLSALLAEAGRSTEPVAVLYCDLDDFKPVNDLAGHAAGDICLRVAARRLRSAVRPGDTVARIGGDEFVLLCPGLHDETAAREVAERVTAAFAEPFLLPDHGRFTLGISVGAVLGTGSDTPETALARADAAMYRDKAARKAARRAAREAGRSVAPAGV
jgi:diguanylate cyclase (GGDEF)-like protein